MTEEIRKKAKVKSIVAHNIIPNGDSVGMDAYGEEILEISQEYTSKETQRLIRWVDNSRRDVKT